MRESHPHGWLFFVTTLAGDGWSEFMRSLERRRRAFLAELPDSPTSWISIIVSDFQKIPSPYARM